MIKRIGFKLLIIIIISLLYWCGRDGYYEEIECTEETESMESASPDTCAAEEMSSGGSVPTVVFETNNNDTISID